VPYFITVLRFASRRNTVSTRSATISLNAASPEGIPFACMTAAAISADVSGPPALQDDIARIVFHLAGNEEPPVALSAEERAALDLSQAAAARGEFATDDQVRAVWAKHGL
jgi:hypothetical protein